MSEYQKLVEKTLIKFEEDQLPMLVASIMSRDPDPDPQNRGYWVGQLKELVVKGLRAAKPLLDEKNTQLAEARKDSERWRARTEFLIERPDGFEWYKQDINCCIVVDPYDEDEHFCAMSWSEAIDQAIAAVEGE